MKCLSCGADNRPGRRFCGNCGQALSRRCSECGFENDAEDRFCGGCGIALADPSGGPAEPAIAAPKKLFKNSAPRFAAAAGVRVVSR